MSNKMAIGMRVKIGNLPQAEDRLYIIEKLYATPCGIKATLHEINTWQMFGAREDQHLVRTHTYIQNLNIIP